MNTVIINDLKIEDIIYEIRGKQVMLDSDLAKLFNYETKQLNRQVLRNRERFPDDYCFQLSELEYQNLRCQNVTSSSNYGGRRYLPYVFTEYGVTMLAGILKSDVAVKISLQIVEAFILMRKYISSNNYGNRISNLETKMIETESKINKLFDKFDERVHNHIFFEGQIYDAYSLLVDILKEAKESIILIDNYIDKNILDIILLLNIKVTIITGDYNKYDVIKYREQYDNMDIIHSKKFHDRFIILDYKILYHSGASFKDLGKRCFSINKIENKIILEQLLNFIYDMV